MDPQLAELVGRLAQLAITNTASAISGRVKSATTGRAQAEQINQLNEIINDLVKDRNELIGIAQSLEQLSGRMISKDDIEFITNTLMPAVQPLVASGNSMSEAASALAVLQSVLTPEVLTVMQLIGFNYKEAIGEPLTQLLRDWILAQGPKTPNQPPSRARK